MHPNQSNFDFHDLDFSDPNDFYTLLTGFTQQEPPPSPSMINPDNMITPLEFSVFDYDAAQESPSLSPVSTVSAIPSATQAGQLGTELSSAGDTTVSASTVPDVSLASGGNMSLSSGTTYAEPVQSILVNGQPSIANTSSSGILSGFKPLDTVYGIDGVSPELMATIPRTTFSTTPVHQRVPPLPHAPSSDPQNSILDYVDQTTVYSSAQVTMPQDLVDDANTFEVLVDPSYSQICPPIGTSSGFYPHHLPLQQFPLLQHAQCTSPQYPHYQHPQHPQHQYLPPQYSHPQFPLYQVPHFEYSHPQHSYHNCHHSYCNAQYHRQPWVGHTSLEAALPFSYYPPPTQAYPVVVNGTRHNPQDSLLQNKAPSGIQPRKHRDEVEDKPLVRRMSSRKRSVSESRKPILQKVKHFLQSSTRLGIDCKQGRQGPRSHSSSSLAPIYASPGFTVSAPNLSPNPYPTNAPLSPTLSLRLASSAPVAEVDLEGSSQSSKKITDSAHFRSRNAFFVFRGFVSRLQSEAAATHPDMNRSQAQTKVSMSCGKLWGLDCIEPCTPMEADCVNCRTRALFLESASNLKHRQEVIQRQLKFPSSSPSSSDSTTYYGEAEVWVRREATSMRRATYVTIEDAFDWREFQELYPHTDLFRWYRERSQTGDTALDLQELRRIWIENETNYEKAFVEGAKKRIAQEMARKHAK